VFVVLTSSLAPLLSTLQEPFEDPWLRYSKDVSTRSPPSPHIPGGANHKLSDNYYCNRDFKREEIPIVSLYPPHHPAFVHVCVYKHVHCNENELGGREVRRRSPSSRFVCAGWYG
jgi:hypothetical protein